MYNNDYMYAIERNDEYLAHYGIRGMKWGVRKAIASGNSARLGRQYAKAQKKLAKLEKRASNSKKYARRAALMGAGAAAAGGLAAAGTGGVAAASRGLGKGLHAVGNLAGAYGRTPGKMNPIKRASTSAAVGIHRAANALTRVGSSSGVINTWGNSNSIGKKAGAAMYKHLNSNAAPGLNKALIKTTGNNVAGLEQKLGRVSNNTIARIGAGAVGAGLAVGAARNAYKAATAKKKAEKFRAAMNESFKGTKYANGGNNGSSKPRQGKKRRR